VNDRKLSCFDRGASLRSGNFNFALTHNHVSLRIGIDLDAEPAGTQRADRDVRRINLHIRLAALQHGVTGISLRYLDLNVSARKIGNLGLALGRQTQNIGVVQLDLCARLFPGSNLVTTLQRRINCGG
jgi:hypothetical protein